MKLASTIALLLVCTVALAQNPTPTADEYAFFQNHVEELFWQEVPQEDSLSLREIMPSAPYLDFAPLQVGEPNQEWYVGELHFPLLPVYAAVYKVNLKGNEEAEYVGILELSPLMGGDVYLMVFDSKSNGCQLLDEVSVVAWRNPFELRIKPFFPNKRCALITTSDLHRSVKMTQGYRIWNWKENGLALALEINTLYWGDYIDEELKVDMEEVSGGKVPRLTVSGTRTNRKEGTESIQTIKEHYHWDAVEDRYVLEE